jgi:acyl carrier protein
VLDVDSLRVHLQSVLPQYMVPAAFVKLDALPLTPNGKLDRKALPAPEGDAYSRRVYEAPSGEIEEVLASLWQSVLKVERVGRQDNFFELGGHSLLVMQLVLRIRHKFSITAPITLMFEFPTLEQLAVRVGHLRHLNLTAQLSSGEDAVEKLMERVSLMSDSQVRESLRELKEKLRS